MAANTLTPPEPMLNVGSPVTLATFCAALQGIVANPAFFSAVYQGSPEAAVEFARKVTAEIQRRTT